MAWRTRSAVACGIFELPRMTRDAVERDTPATRLTSSRVMRATVLLGDPVIAAALALDIISAARGPGADIRTPPRDRLLRSPAAERVLGAVHVPPAGLGHEEGRHDRDRSKERKVSGDGQPGTVAHALGAHDRGAHHRGDAPGEDRRDLAGHRDSQVALARAEELAHERALGAEHPPRADSEPKGHDDDRADRVAV